MMINSPIRKSAFSLMELAIVLAIIGLLAGGVVVGQNMIRSAELRGVIQEKERYETAIRSFQEQYGYLPGDMPNAVTIWPGAAGAIRNGNGNGIVQHGGPVNEHLNFARHLYVAGLVETQYTGMNDGVTTLHISAGINIPGTKLDSYSGWLLCTPDTITDGLPRIMFARPGWSSSVCAMGESTSLKAEEMMYIDTKMDDGVANQGKVTAQNGYSTNLAGIDCIQSGAYDLSETNAGCRFIVLMD